MVCSMWACEIPIHVGVTWMRNNCGNKNKPCSNTPFDVYSTCHWCFFFCCMQYFVILDSYDEVQLYHGDSQFCYRDCGICDHKTTCLCLTQRLLRDAAVILQINVMFRADSRFAPSQWKTLLQSNVVSHWPGASLESALMFKYLLQIEFLSTCEIVLRWMPQNYFDDKSALVKVLMAWYHQVTWANVEPDLCRYMASLLGTKSLPWLLTPWLLAEPGHQQSKYWQCDIDRLLAWVASFRRNLNSWCHLNIEKWEKLKLYFYVS